MIITMKKINILFLTILLFSVSSCSKFLDVNVDPNNPTNVDPSFVLPVAQTSVGGVIGGDIAIVTGLWAQHWTQSHTSSQYKTLDAYDLISSNYNTSWNEMYAGGLNDCEVVKKAAVASSNWNLYLQATATQAFGYHIFADLFDQIPYSESLKGVDNTNPKFDKGQDVYAGIHATLDAALAKDFSASTNLVSKTDLIFPSSSLSSQVNSWKKFANTLKMKMYLRAGDYTNPKLLSYLANPSLVLNEDAAITQFVDEANRSNFLFENNVRQLNTGGNLRMSRTIFSYLDLNKDYSRMDAYFTPGSTGQFSLIQGDYEHSTADIAPTRVSIAKMSATDAFYFFSTDEVLFMLAEIAQRSGASESVVKGYYDSAVTAAYTKFGISVTPSFLAVGGAYAFPTGGTSDAKLKSIMTQKWLAMFKQGWEAFFDQTRTGIPAYSTVSASNAAYIPGTLTYSFNGVTSGLFPKRLLFPSASKDVNKNTPALIPVTTKVWWQK
jgi:Starch-binding associating with outer membrane